MSEKRDMSEAQRPHLFPPSSLAQPSASSHSFGSPNKPPGGHLELGCSKAGSTSSLPSYQQASSSGLSASMFPQKGKLILPTALWILIVVAGLCFLSLMASLNKSMNTLDTLVELEQERAKHDQLHHHKSHHSNFNHKHHPERLSLDADYDLDGEGASGEPTWLSMPSWTSLEPVSSAKPEFESTFKRLINGLFGDNPQQQAEYQTRVETLPSGDTIIFASSSDGRLPPARHHFGHPAESLLQAAPMVMPLESFIVQDQHPMHPNSHYHQPDQEVEFLPVIDHVGDNLLGRFNPEFGFHHSNPSAAEKSSPLITANIDHVDIHLDSSQQWPDQSQLVNLAGPAIKSNDVELDNMKALENSLDSLISSLVESSAQAEASSASSNPAGSMFGRPKQQAATDNLVFMPFSSTKSQPADHIFTLDLGPDVVGQVEVKTVPEESFDFESSKQTTTQNKTPYELEVLDQAGRPKLPVKSAMDAALAKLADDLTQSLMDDLMSKSKQNQVDQDQKLVSLSSSSSSSSTPSSVDSQSEFISIKNFSLPTFEELLPSQASPPVDDKKQQQQHHNMQQDGPEMEQLFKLFFGPPPESKLVVAPQKTSNTLSQPDKQNDTGISMTTPVSVDIVMASTLPTKVVGDEPTRNKLQLASALTGSSADDKPVDISPNLDSLVDSFFDGMSTSAQFGTERDAVKVDSSKPAAASDDKSK